MFDRTFYQLLIFVLSQGFCSKGLAFEKIFAKTVEMNPQQMQSQLIAIAAQLTKLAESMGMMPKTAEPKQSAAEVQKCVANRICLLCKKPIEPDKKVVRGLHEGCRKMVQEEYYGNEDAAINDGVLLPPDKGGRKRSELRDIAAEKAREGLSKKIANSNKKS